LKTYSSQLKFDEIVIKVNCHIFMKVWCICRSALGPHCGLRAGWPATHPWWYGVYAVQCSVMFT